MKKLILLFMIPTLLLTGCNSTNQTSAEVASTIQVQQAVPQGTATDTGTIDNPETVDGVAVTGDASTGGGLLYPAYTDIDNIEKWGYINKKGEFVIEPQFDYAYAFKDNGLAIVRINSLEGVIDNSGKFVLKPEYGFISEICGDVIVAYSEKEGYMLLNLKGDKLYATNDRIGSFKEDLATFAMQVDDNNTVFGYIDRKGEIAIEPVFKLAYDFNEGTALVEMQDESYALIDKTGKVMKRLDFNIVGNLSEGIFVYRSTDEKYGYMTQDGNKLTDAIFLNASPFEDGLAVVDVSNDYSNPMYGLMDKSGKYVLEPKFGGIIRLGQGRYSASESTHGNGSDTFCKKAVFTDKGEQITDMVYYDISPFANGISSVSTDTQTFIIGLDGRPIGRFAVIDGVGTVSCIGELIDAYVDGELLYMTMDGRTVWKSGRVFNLKNGAVIRQNKYRPDRCLMVHYPVISNHPDAIVQEKLNKIFRENFVGDNPVSTKEGEAYSEDSGCEYGLSQVGDLLVVQQSSWYYFVGAAHGSMALSVYHANTVNGNTYALKDLFRSGSDYIGRITGLINKQIREQIQESGEGDNSMYFVDKVENISPEQGFIITDKALQIYYQTYEIAAYAAGQPTFDIGYDEIIDIIDTEGELWKTVGNSLKYGK